MRSWWTGKCAPPFSACKQLRTPNSRASEPGDCQNPSRSAFCQSLSVCLSGLASMCVPVAARLWKMSISKASKAVDCLHFPVVGLSVGACLFVCLSCVCCLRIPQGQGTKQQNRIQAVSRCCWCAAWCFDLLYVHKAHIIQTDIAWFWCSAAWCV